MSTWAATQTVWWPNHSRASLNRRRRRKSTRLQVHIKRNVLDWEMLLKRANWLLTLEQIAGNSQKYDQNEHRDYEQYPDHWKMSKNSELERVGESNTLRVWLKSWCWKMNFLKEFWKESDHALVGYLPDRPVFAKYILLKLAFHERLTAELQFGGY